MKKPLPKVARKKKEFLGEISCKIYLIDKN
jgi:hypothetical protein